MRPLYAFIGMRIGAMIDLTVNLLAAAIQQRPWGAQVLRDSVGWLIGLIVVGLMLGL
jgi:hypothetical protein